MTGRRYVALVPLLGALVLGKAMAADTPTAGDTATAKPTTATPGKPAPAAAPTATGTTAAPGTATAPATGTPPATTPGDALAPDAEEQVAEYNRELRTVEQDVDRLKERVFRSKATLQLLKELVLEGSTQGSRVVLWHENKMGGAYSLQSVQYFLDGKNIYNKVDEKGGLDSQKEIKLMEQALPPGQHNLQVTLVLRGSGYGVFSYLKSYSFKVQSSYSFTVEDGKQTDVKVIANEKGGPWRTFVDRPNVTYQETTEHIQSGDSAPGTSEGGE